jgi:hypothetical protein
VCSVKYILWTPHISYCFVCSHSIDDSDQEWPLVSSKCVHLRRIFSRLARFRQLLFPSVFCCSFPLHKPLRRVDFAKRGCPIAPICDRSFSKQLSFRVQLHEYSHIRKYRNLRTVAVYCCQYVGRGDAFSKTTWPCDDDNKTRQLIYHSLRFAEPRIFRTWAGLI